MQTVPSQQGDDDERPSVQEATARCGIIPLLQLLLGMEIRARTHRQLAVP